MKEKLMKEVITKYKNFLIPALIIIVAILISILFANIKSAPSKKKKEIPFVAVNIIDINPSDHVVKLYGFGTVEATYTHQIVTQVKGPIIYQFPNLEVGKNIKKDDVILTIQPDEYRFLVEKEKANSATAEFNLKEEQGKQAVAKREWELLDKKIRDNVIDKELALRQAHLKEKQFALKAAKNSLKLAELNLQRTKIIAPCDGVILSESIAVGQVVKLGEKVADFACTDFFRIVVSIPQDQIKWLSPADKILPNAKAVIQGHEAKVVELLSDVDRNSKMAKLLLQIDNKNNQKQPLLIGQFVKAQIAGKTVNNLYRIPETTLREGDIIWLAQDNKLLFQAVNVVARQENYLLVDLPKSLKSGKLKLITSYIASPYEGMKIKEAS